MMLYSGRTGFGAARAAESMVEVDNRELGKKPLRHVELQVAAVTCGGFYASFTRV